jgi:hypothetical protein
MARERNYGWSPEQLARINARREARGQDLYIDKKMGGVDYMDKYKSESEKYASKATQSKPAFPSERPQKISLKDRTKARTEEFAKRFKPKGSMGIEKSVQSEAAKLKKKPVMGIGTPSLQGSFNRFTA